HLLSNFIPLVRISLQLSSDILHLNNQEKKVIQDDTMTPEEKGKTTNSIFQSRISHLVSKLFLPFSFF
ncbi:MAG: hypothetical protein WAM54_00460, partial [Nitrososphaeraceae archaeon]